MSYTWDNLETLPIEQIIQIFIHHSSVAKNILIAQIVGPKPIHYLPEEIINHIVNFLSIYGQITFGRTCKKYYSYALKATKEYCLLNLYPLAWHDDNFRWEVISQLSDDKLVKSIKNMLRDRKTAKGELLAFIYHHTHDRQIWQNINNDNRVIFEGDGQVIELITRYSTFGKFLQTIIDSTLTCGILVDILKVLPRASLSREKWDSLIRNVEDIYDIKQPTPLIQKLINWRDQCGKNKPNFT